MLTATQQALATPDILTTILEHLYSARLHFKDSNYLSPACLVAQAWRKPAQELLHWRIAFHRGTAQLKQWLAAIGDEKESKFVTWEIVIEDSEQVVEGEGWDLEVVKEVLGKVKGVTSLALAMMREREIPTEWIMGKNLKNVAHLVLGCPLSTSTRTPPFNLASIGLFDRHPHLGRDWANTCKILARQRKDREYPILSLELVGIEGHNRYLCPELPLSRDPLAIRGNFLNIADSLLFLTIPSLLPVPELPNLAIFGAACRSLKVLSISLVTPHSASSIPILQFFPTIDTLQIHELVGLPNGHNLHVDQLRRFANSGFQGNVVPILAMHYYGEKGVNLKMIHVFRYKYVSGEQKMLFWQALGAKGGGYVAFQHEIQLTREEQLDVNRLEAEAQALNAEQELSKTIGKIKAQIAELEVKAKEEKAIQADGAM